MQQIIDYIIANWQWLTPIVLSVVEFFILLIFKKTVNVEKFELFKNGLFEAIPIYIQMAEEKFGAGHGEDKMNYVLSLYEKANPSPLFSLVKPVVKSFVESVLECPQKKGGN